MKKLFLILLAFLSFTVQAQFVTFMTAATMTGGTPVVDSTAFDVWNITGTLKLGSTGVVIAEIDTSSVAALTDTVRFYITGSDQPTADTVLQASIDTSLQVGAAGVVWDSITLNTGEIRWYSGGVYKDISEVIYTTPNAPTTLTISSPDSDTLTYAVSGFTSPANGTVSDSCLVLWDTIAIPTESTDGNLVYLGDTTVAETDFFIDMADSLEVYVSAFSKNDGTLGEGAWSVARTDSVFIDSTAIALPDSATSFVVSSPNKDSVNMAVIGFDATADNFVVNWDYVGGGFPADSTDGTKQFAFPVADTALYNDTTFAVTIDRDTTLYFTMRGYDANGIGDVNQDTVAVDTLGSAAYGAELVVDGAMTSSANWNEATNCTVTGGVLDCNTQPAYSGTAPTNTIAVVAGTTYRVEYTISNYSSGNVQFSFAGGGTGNGTVNSGNDTYIENLIPTQSNSTFYLGATNLPVTCDWDNVSVKEVL